MSLDVPLKPDWALLDRAAPTVHMGVSVADVVHAVKGQLAYVACPFARGVRDDLGHWDRTASMHLELRAARWVRLLAVHGIPAVCPVAARCQMLSADMENELRPLNGAFWAAYSRPFLFAASVVIVPPMPGWRKSREVWADARWAVQSNVPVWQIGEAG